MHIHIAQSALLKRLLYDHAARWQDANGCFLPLSHGIARHQRRQYEQNWSYCHGVRQVRAAGLPCISRPIRSRPRNASGFRRGRPVHGRGQVCKRHVHHVLTCQPHCSAWKCRSFFIKPAFPSSGNECGPLWSVCAIRFHRPIFLLPPQPRIIARTRSFSLSSLERPYTHIPVFLVASPSLQNSQATILNQPRVHAGHNMEI
jgi:hypothetical protein